MLHHPAVALVPGAWSQSPPVRDVDFEGALGERALAPHPHHGVEPAGVPHMNEEVVAVLLEQALEHPEHQAAILVLPTAGERDPVHQRVLTRTSRIQTT